MKSGNGAETLSQDDLRKIFKNEKIAIRWMEEIRWGDTGIICPKCGSFEKITERRKDNRKWCGSCRSYFNVKTGTPMEDTKLGVRQWIEATQYLMTARFGISTYELSKQMGITQKTAWYLLQRIRIVCGDSLQINLKKLTGTVEIDETFLGPVVSRMNDESRAKWEAKWGKGKRGSSGKGMVIGLRERETGTRVYVAYAPSQRPRKPTVEKLIAKYVDPDAVIYTDDASYYTDLRNLGYKGDTLNRSATPKEWVKGNAWTNGIESDWNVVKRGWNTYTRWTMKYGQLYANEFAFRLDKGSCKRDTIDRLESVFGAMKGKTITYKELIKYDTEENISGKVRRDAAFNNDYKKYVKNGDAYLEDDYIPF